MPQDLNDESASTLLERIRAERPLSPSSNAAAAEPPISAPFAGARNTPSACLPKPIVYAS